MRVVSSIVEFNSSIGILGINPYVLVDSVNATALRKDWREPMPVIVQIDNLPDVPYHTNMMPSGNGEFYLYLHNGIRKASDTKVGDTVNVKMWFDHEYRNGPMHNMPERFKQLLGEHTDAAANWRTLSPSRQKEVLRYFAGLKSDEAMERNILRAIHVFNG
jgi:hypothetical protein